MDRFPGLPGRGRRLGETPSPAQPCRLSGDAPPPAPVPARHILGLPHLEAESGAIQNVAPRSSISRGGSLPAAGREKLAKLPLPSKRLRK
jgi:hypothetical protein